MFPRREEQLITAPYQNQWRALRLLRNLTQRDVVHCLNHYNTKYYQDIEAGRRFPHARILFRLLALYDVGIAQAYPNLLVEAQAEVDRLRR